MRRVLTIVILTLAAMMLSISAALSQTHKQDSTPKGKPTLYIFSSQSCPPCIRLYKEGMNDAEISAMIFRMELHNVDMGSTKDAQKLYKQHARSGGIPELVLYDGNGKLIGREVGFETCDRMAKFLRQAFSADELKQIKAEQTTWKTRFGNNTN